jgi:hypothetical protein
MKRLHLVLLLAGVLAIGSAFTTFHRDPDPCAEKTLYHRTGPSSFVPLSVAGECQGTEDKCIWADTDNNSIADTPCDYDTGTFQVTP